MDIQGTHSKHQADGAQLNSESTISDINTTSLSQLKEAVPNNFQPKGLKQATSQRGEIHGSKSTALNQTALNQLAQSVKPTRLPIGTPPEKRSSVVKTESTAIESVNTEASQAKEELRTKIKDIVAGELKKAFSHYQSVGELTEAKQKILGITTEALLNNLPKDKLDKFNNAKKHKLNELVKTAAPLSLFNALRKPAKSEADPNTLSSISDIGHIHSGSLDTRVALQYLGDQELTATRALNHHNKEQLLSGNPLKNSGDGTNIVDQVKTGKTAFLSASARPVNIFSGNNSGFVVINTPKFYNNLAAIKKNGILKDFPTPESGEISTFRAQFKSETDVITALEEGGGSHKDLENARNANEVLFKGPINSLHITILDEGLGSIPVPTSRLAENRVDTRTDKALKKQQSADEKKIEKFKNALISAAQGRQKKAIIKQIKKLTTDELSSILEGFKTDKKKNPKLSLKHWIQDTEPDLLKLE